MLYKHYLGQQQCQPCLLLFASCWLLLKGDCQHTYNVIGNNLILLARLSFVSWKKEKWSHSDVFLQSPWLYSNSKGDGVMWERNSSPTSINDIFTNGNFPRNTTTTICSLSLHPVHILENRHKPGWLWWTLLHILIPARNAAKASPQELQGHTWQEAECFSVGWWVPETSFEPSAWEMSTEEHDFTAVVQNKEISKGAYSKNLSKPLCFF